MNISKRLKKVGVAAAIGATAIMSSVAVNAATIGFIGDDGLLGGDIAIDQTVTPTFSLTLAAEGLLSDSYGGGLGITFDSSVVNITGAAINSTWNIPSFDPVTDIDNTAGTFEFIAATFFFGVSPIDTTRQDVITIDFSVVGNGQFDFGFFATDYGTGNIATGDWAYTPALTPAGAGDLTYCLTTDSALPTTCIDSIADVFEAPDGTTGAQRELLTLVSSNIVVPVPAAVWLFGSGLIGLVAVSRRKAA